MPGTIEIIGVPIDLGQNKRGVDMGPAALTDTGYRVHDCGNIAVPIRETVAHEQPLHYLPAITASCRATYDAVRAVAARGGIPLCIGGDHTLAIGSIGGVTHDAPSGLLWIDAHGDFNTPETTLTGNIHGMTLAVLLGDGYPGLVDLGRPGAKLRPDDVVLIGVRDLDPMERVRLRESGVTVYTMRNIDERGIAAVTREALARLEHRERLHVTVDLDALDPQYSPGVGTPAPGGLTCREAQLLMELLASSGRCASLDIVEINPILDHHNRTARLAGHLGPAGGSLLAKALTVNIRELARQFIIAERSEELVPALTALRQQGCAAVVDLLGEATLTVDEAESYVAIYLALLDLLARAQEQWPPLPGQGRTPDLDWGSAPRINIAVKPTALSCRVNPLDFEGSVRSILAAVRRICDRTIAVGGFLCLDMEAYRVKDITLEVYHRLKEEYREYPHLGIVLQSYLRDTDRDLTDLLAWGRQRRIPLAIRLVKGAYWDYETVKARQAGWPVPVRSRKAETDAAFERHARQILGHHDLCHLACATHNIRSLAAVLESARAERVPEERYEFQLLYGMAEPVRRALLAESGRVRLYTPFGDLVPGMGYLVRRLLENSANESFLRQNFAGTADQERLLADPAPVAAVEKEQGRRNRDDPDATSGYLPPFRNEPPADFTRLELRAAFPAVLVNIRAAAGRTYPLLIGGMPVRTADLLPSLNPNRPSEVLGLLCQAGPGEVERAVAVARQALPAWRATSPRDRAACLVRAAAAARRRLVELAAWQVLEIGKQWDQAHADVTEAIDFLEYYAREMLRLAEPHRLGDLPGERNETGYEPRGIAAVIAPWNFPLAISVGMVAAALVTGSPVLYKPSGLTGIIGSQVAELFREAGLPAGVLSFLPGRGNVIGDLLVDHPEIGVIVFTGSMEVGLRIIQRAAVVHPGQVQVKKVIAEMGGKNAIIIDDDADLDEAVPQVLASAFGFQGQKCSACSRVIVVDGIHDRFVARLAGAARSWRIGPAEDPANDMGAVAEAAARRKIREYVAIGKHEGTVLYESPVPEEEGYWVPLTIIGGIRPEHRLAQEEIFGPVLAVMRATDFTEALAWANSTRFALTGGVFSRSPDHLGQARREFRVGNLYLNRGITGALVARQPFGGSRLSGIGTKAGGAEYLAHFMTPRVVTENTLRRGFAPREERGATHVTESK